MGIASGIFDRLTLYVQSDRSARIGGLEMGKLTVLHVEDRPQDGDGRVRLIVKEAGHRYWVGVGCPWEYAPTEYHVFDAVEQPGSGIGTAQDRYTIVREVECLTPAAFRARKRDLVPTPKEG